MTLFALGCSLVSDDQLPGNSQQDEGRQAGDQQEHVGRLGLKLRLRTEVVLDGKEQQRQADDAYQPLVPGHGHALAAHPHGQTQNQGADDDADDKPHIP